MDYVFFRFNSFDSAELPQKIPAGYTSTFFCDSVSEGATSVTYEVEKAIVRWFFSKEFLRQTFLEELRLHIHCRIFFEVDKPIITDRNKKPGDIDVLICEATAPDRAVAIECKRVKCIIQQNGNETVNKIGDIRDAVYQANALQSMGFYKTYLAVFIEVDGRNRRDLNFLGRGLSDEKFKELYDFPLRDKLHKNVGIIFIEIVQPIDRLVNRAAHAAIGILRDALPQEQSSSLVNRICEFHHR